MNKNLFSLFLYRVERTLGAFFIAVLSCFLIVFFILLFVIQLPFLLMIKGETTRAGMISKIIILGLCSYILGFLAGKKAPKCIHCGATDFSTRKNKDGYNVSWVKVNDDTGEALCTACEDTIDLIE